MAMAGACQLVAALALQGSDRRWNRRTLHLHGGMGTAERMDQGSACRDDRNRSGTNSQCGQLHLPHDVCSADHGARALSRLRDGTRTGNFG